MQFPLPTISILTIPTGASPTTPRIVIDGTRGAIFEYVAGGPLGALVGSWATKSGTDPYGNIYPAGFQVSQGSILSPTILGYANAVPRGPYNVSFESGIDGWAGLNGTVSQSSAWASDGSFSLLLTASGAGDPIAGSPYQKCAANDPVAATFDIYAPAVLSHVYVGIQWYDANKVFISETDSTDTAFAAGQAQTLTVGDISPSNAAYYTLVFGDHNVDPINTLLYGDNISASGNLAFSAAVESGTDIYGNPYDQGIVIYSLPGLTNSFTVEDAFGNTLASIDAMGNITGTTITANTDLVLAGQSLTNDILPSLPLGLISYGYIQNSNLPTTLDASGTTRVLYELDQQVTPGRTYKISLGNCGLSMSAAGNRMFLTVKATQDGSTPSLTNGDVILKAGVYCPVTTWYFAGAHRTWRPPSSPTPITLRTIVMVEPFGASGQITQAFDSTFSQDNSDTLSLSIEDIGPNLGENATWINSTGGSGGTGTQTYTKYYTATHTYSYQGSDGAQPNQKINTDGRCYQGGNFSETSNGHAKTWILFNYSQIASDLAGSTINWVRLKLQNNHTWYNSGMTVAVGWDTTTSFPGTKSDPSGADIDIKEYGIGEGQYLSQYINNAFAVAFRDSGATTIVLYKNSNNLQFYGYFAGASQSNPPQLVINYTK